MGRTGVATSKPSFTLCSLPIIVNLRFEVYLKYDMISCYCVYGACTCLGFMLLGLSKSLLEPDFYTSNYLESAAELAYLVLLAPQLPDYSLEI